MSDFVEAPGSIDDLTINPEKWGFVSFETWRKQKEKWSGRRDDVFASVDEGSKLLHKYIRKQEYYINNYLCASLEQVERIAGDLGVPIDQLVCKPNIRVESAYRGVTEARFYTPDFAKRRAEW